jgi:hypothetical protein
MRKEMNALLENARSSLPIVLPSEVKPSAPGAQGQGNGIFNEAAVPLDDVVVFNRMHLRVFSSDPRYRDIFTYINSFAPRVVRAREVANALGCATGEAETLLETLSELGVIVAEKEGSATGFRASKRVFYFPDDEDFFPLRNLNLRHNAEAILSRLTYREIADRKAYRGLITRELTEQQLQYVVEQLDQLIGKVVALPETANPRTIYSLSVLMGERFSRASAED